MSYNTAHPHIASYLIVRKDDKVAFLLRSNAGWMNGYYGLPSGKVEKDENYISAAIREGLEEIGIKLTPKNLKHVLTLHRYEPSEQANDWVDIYFEATQWKGELHNAEPHIHSELAWLNPKNLPTNVIESVKFALTEIDAGKTYSEYGWNK